MRKTTKLLTFGSYFLLSVLFFLTTGFKNKETGPWKEKQLIYPEVLAERINNNNIGNLIIVNTGPVENIKGAVSFGAVEELPNLEKLKTYLLDIPRSKEVIIYCGCCPLAVCPNLEPAYKALKKMGFADLKILRLVNDLEEDWINKGFPVE